MNRRFDKQRRTAGFCSALPYGTAMRRKQVSITLDADHIRRLKEIADREQRSISQVAGRILIEGLDRVVEAGRR
jgi:hypothetical protein